MVVEKSEAQIRNEQEVKRILAERGYSYKNQKKKVNKAFAHRFPVFKFGIVVVVLGILCGGAVWLIKHPDFFKNEDLASNNDYSSTDNYDDAGYLDFLACVNAVDSSDVSIDDAQFWYILKGRYEQTIACYDNYPSVADADTRAELESNLAEINGNIATGAAADISYQQRMTDIDNQLQKNIAEITKRGEEWDAELSRRIAEREANSAAQREEYERQRAEYEARTAAAAAEAERIAAEKAARCAQYDGKSSTELADADPAVISAKNSMNYEIANYNNAYNRYNCANSNVVLTQSQCESRKAKIAEAEAKANAARITYNNIRNSKISEYSSILISCR